MSGQIVSNHPILSYYFQYEYQLDLNQLAASILASIALYVDIYSIQKIYNQSKLQSHEMSQALINYFKYIQDCKTRFASLNTEAQIQNLAILLENPLLPYKHKHSIYVSKLFISIASIFGVKFKIISEDSYKTYGNESNQPFNLFIYKNKLNIYTLFPIDYYQLTDDFLAFIKVDIKNLTSCGHSLLNYSKTSKQCTECKKYSYELEKKYIGQGQNNNNNKCTHCINNPVSVCNRCRFYFCLQHSSSNICSLCQNILNIIPAVSNSNNDPNPVNNQFVQKDLNNAHHSPAKNNSHYQDLNYAANYDQQQNPNNFGQNIPIVNKLPNNPNQGLKNNPLVGQNTPNNPIGNNLTNYPNQGLPNIPLVGQNTPNNQNQNIKKLSPKNKNQFVPHDDNFEILIDIQKPQFKYNFEHFLMFYHNNIKNCLQKYQNIIVQDHSIKSILKIFLSYQSNRNIILISKFQKHINKLNQLKTLIQNSSKAKFDQISASIIKHLRKHPKNQNFQPEYIKILKIAFLFSARIIITEDKKLVFGPKTKLTKLWIIFIDLSRNQILIRIKNPKNSNNRKDFNKEEAKINKIVDENIDQINDKIKSKNLKILSLICGCKENCEGLTGRGFLPLREFRCKDHQEKLHGLEVEFIEKNIYRNCKKCGKCGSVNGSFIKCKKCKLMYCDSECVNVAAYQFQNHGGNVKCPNCLGKLQSDDIDNNLQIDIIDLGYCEDKIKVHAEEILKPSTGIQNCKTCNLFKAEENSKCRVCAEKKKI